MWAIIHPGQLFVQLAIKELTRVKGSKDSKWLPIQLTFCPAMECVLALKRDHVRERQIPTLKSTTPVIVLPITQLQPAEKQLLATRLPHLIDVEESFSDL